MFEVGGGVKSETSVETCLRERVVPCPAGSVKPVRGRHARNRPVRCLYGRPRQAKRWFRGLARTFHVPLPSAPGRRETPGGRYSSTSHEHVRARQVDGCGGRASRRATGA